MLELDEINNTIAELENGSTTFDSCIKLAALYTVRDKYRVNQTQDTEPETQVKKELSDILPHYEAYCDTKRNYQLGQIGKDQVIRSIQIVCKEITEFINTLYSSTDMEEEREILTATLSLIKFSGY